MFKPSTLLFDIQLNPSYREYRIMRFCFRFGEKSSDMRGISFYTTTHEVLSQNLTVSMIFSDVHFNLYSIVIFSLW